MQSWKTWQTLLLALVLVAATAFGVSAQDLRMASGQQGSQNYGVNAALAQALQTYGGLNVSVQAYGGPAAFLPLLHRAQLDLAALVMPDAGDAIRGTGPFQGFPMVNVQLVASLFPSPVGLMVAANSGIESISDLRGKRVAYGLPSQPSLVPYVEGALANGGLTTRDVTLVPVTSVANGVDELMAGRVDATLFALRGGKVVEADSALGGIRFLPFDPSPQAVAAMQAVAPDAYLVEVKAEDGVLGINRTMYTMAYDYVLVAGVHVPDALIQRVVQVLKEHGPEFSANSSFLDYINPETLYRPYQGLMYHRAAEAALKSQ